MAMGDTRLYIERDRLAWLGESESEEVDHISHQHMKKLHDMPFEVKSIKKTHTWSCLHPYILFTSFETLFELII